MSLSGTLRTWNDERGFGFIAPSHGGPELFVHISAFPQDGTRPTVGERLEYEFGRGKSGKPQATKVVRLAVGARGPKIQSVARQSTFALARTLGSGILALGFVSLGVYGFGRFQDYSKRRTLERAPATLATEPTPAQSHSEIHCDGRTMCSQMTSCAEATWFINNCPGTKMDSNHDGVPCEQQWCN